MAKRTSACTYLDGHFEGARYYSYNDEGLRIKKHHGAEGSINYFYNGSNLVTEESYGFQKNFYYDESGNLIGCRIDGADYYYVKNLQNDVIGILDKDGNQVVSYTYDAWGKQLSVTGTMATTIGTQNPFRYRSYYYDFESGFYYLNSRYYDPDVGRFINADTTDVLDVDQDSLIENNLFAYCLNNPVNMHDSSGEVALALAGGGYIATSIAFGALNIWNPAGWTVLGVATFVVVGGGLCVATYKIGVVVGKLGRIIKATKAAKAKKPKKKSKESGKDKADNPPSWSKKEKYNNKKSADSEAQRVLDKKYGKGNWKKGAGEEHNQIKKWLQRSKGFK